MRQSQPLLVSHVNMAEAFQRHGGVPTIQADMGCAMADGHIDVTVQVGQVLALERELVMAGDKVLDDVSASRMGGKVRRYMACPSNEIGVVVGTARHRRAVRGNVISEMRARRTAGIHQRVVTRAQINRVVAEAAQMVRAETFVMRLTAAVATESMAARTTIGATDVSVIGVPTTVAESSRSMLIANGSGLDRATPIKVKTVMARSIAPAARNCCVAHNQFPL